MMGLSVHIGQSEVRDVPTETRLRIGDAERERAATVVADAAAAGYIDMTEIDERLDRVWAARTGAELASVLSDLPQRLRAGVERAEPAVVHPGARARSSRRWRGEWSRYRYAMALMVGIWLVVGLTAGAWYPWVIWPALGWGMALLAKIGRPQLRAAPGR